MTAGLEPLRVEQPREVSTSPHRTFSSGVLVGGLACCGLVAMVALFNKNAFFQQTCPGAPPLGKFFGVGAWNPSLMGSTRAVPRTMAKGEVTSGHVKRASTPVMADMAEMETGEPAEMETGEPAKNSVRQPNMKRSSSKKQKKQKAKKPAKDDGVNATRQKMETYEAPGVDTAVKREWRCECEVDGTGKAPAISEILKLVDEYLPKIKELKDVVVNRAVSVDQSAHFTLGMTMSRFEYKEWMSAGFPPEAEFLEKLGKIKGVSQIDTQAWHRYYR